MYAEGGHRCASELRWKSLGEYYYMQSCMTLLEAQCAFDSTLIADDRCWAAPCWDTSQVAYPELLRWHTSSLATSRSALGGTLIA